MIRKNLYDFRLSVSRESGIAEGLIDELTDRELAKARSLAVEYNSSLKQRTLNDYDLWRVLGYPDSYLQDWTKVAVVNKLMETDTSCFELLMAFKHDDLAVISGIAVSEGLAKLGLWNETMGLESLVGNSPDLGRLRVEFVETRNNITYLNWELYGQRSFTIEVHNELESALVSALDWLNYKSDRELVYPFLIGRTLVWRD